MSKGKIVINTLPGPNAEMWNAWYMFRLKQIDLEIKGLETQRNRIIFEMEELALLHKKFATNKTVVSWTLRKRGHR